VKFVPFSPSIRIFVTVEREEKVQINQYRRHGAGKSSIVCVLNCDVTSFNSSLGL